MCVRSLSPVASVRAGEYVLRCHTAAHVNGGMQALYTINASAAVTTAALNGAKTPSGSSVISALAFLSQVLIASASGLEFQSTP